MGATTEFEVSGNRTFYDVADVQAVVPEAADFNEAATSGGWDLKTQLLEAVTLCEFCEVYCLRKDSGPATVPPFAQIDREAVLRDLG